MVQRLLYVYQKLSAGQILELYHKLTEGDDSHWMVVPARALLRWSVVFYRQLVQDRAFIRAAGMAYITLIALVPALMLVFGVLHATGLLDEANKQAVQELIFGTFLGDIPQVKDIIWPGLMKVDLATLGLVGTAGLLVVVARLYLMVEKAYCDIFGVTVERGLTSRLLNFYFTLTAVPIALILATVMVTRVASGLGVGWMSTLLSYGLPVLVIFTALKLFPTVRVGWRASLVGTAVTAVLLYLGGRLFPLYITLFATDDPLRVIYGSVGLIPVFLLWLYLLWIFVLLGVEVAYVVQNYGSLLQVELGQLEQSSSPLRTPSLETALELLAWLAWSFKQGQGPVGAGMLARRAGIRTRQARQVIEVLEHLDLVVSTDKGWMLTRSAEDIDLPTVARSWREHTRVGNQADGVHQELGQALGRSLRGSLAEGMLRWIPAKPLEPDPNTAEVARP